MERFFKKTKIVATIGPKTESVAQLTALVKAGLNVARLNMSHGDHAEHLVKIKNIRTVENKLQGSLPILMDLSGPKIRTGEYTTERITITKGKKVIITTDNIQGTKERFSINYPKLPQEVSKGSILMLDDGKKKLIVEKVVGNEIHTKVVIGGELKSRRGVNIPGAYLSVSSITAKDRKDIAFGLENGVDMFALSFVRTANDVLELQKIMKRAGKVVPVIAKIETQEAIDNLEAILDAADGAMVARGDLAIEVPTELVPVYQKRIIERCNILGKPAITATQMLESMIVSPVPTRAEVSDIANAIYDGTDAVMLSEESTLGAYPVEAVSVMSRVAHANEIPKDYRGYYNTIQDSISRSVYKTARNVKASLIVALTESGQSARLVERFNPNVPIIALTPNRATVQSLALTSNVHAYQLPGAKSFDHVLEFVPEFLKTQKLVKKGDKIVLTAGAPFGVKGSTNMVVVLTIA